ncbi:hypothetical protein PHAVU_007G114700 [Phaseolus vulgaris]|uniref:Uncharacterized protein n=1 Tax=Phaseolus vulgaris TaxID=3885 RepID=V7BGE3_PHAVU|nr:hypothetical protein PHAVU_007G114700g [Phaseolus vulgaris]ESW15928.1 hypothetical protein PHAVU_007G114700g [Phaseolus vulgaris]
MRTPTFLRRLPIRHLQPKAPTKVAPLPQKTRFDRKLAAELDTLRSQDEFGLPQLLDAAITTQKIASDSLVNICYKDCADRGAVDKYLEDNVEILDACNYFMDKMEHIDKYVDSLRVVLHLADKGGAGKPTTRALELLESCQSMEKRCKAMENHGDSCLKKMLQQKLCHETELSEVMCGSKAMALMSCRFLEVGLSFDPKRGLPLMKMSEATSSWLRMLQELEKQAEGSAEKKKVQRSRCWSSLLMQTEAAARELKEQMKGKKEKEMKYAVERLKISCRELENGVEIIEERVKSLYKSLIDVRMTLLGILSHPTHTL